MSVSNATLLAKISALEARVTALAAQVKDDETTLHPLLTASNLTFLAGLTKMPHLGASFSNDGGAGNYWNTGERTFVNNSLNYINAVNVELQDAGLMA